MPPKQLLCRYFSQGCCKFGENCIFSHDPETSIPIPEDVCLFHLRSSCMKGESCEKVHKTIFELISESGIEADVEDLNDYNNPRFIDPIGTSTQNNTIPQVKSYASVASASKSSSDDISSYASKLLCTFYESHGYCPYFVCFNLHGDLCDLCGLYSLHPFNQKQRELHRDECIREHEKSMEVSFAYQRSKDLTCAICLDVVMEKDSRKNSRFGILENCTHVYCIECIRTWRNSNFEKKNKRGCPQCRIKSDFIIPSEYFYEDKEEKEKLINEYKKALSVKHCKYFNKGAGKCPFEGACFYKHEYPDGTKAELPMPSGCRRSKCPMEDYALLFESMFIDFENLDQEVYDDILSEYEDIFFVDD